MKKLWILLAPILILAVLGLVQYKFRMDHSTEMYSKVADEMISEWRSRPFTSLTNIAPIRSVLVYNGGVKLDEAQTDSLLTTVGAWFRAYSEGTECTASREIVGRMSNDGGLIRGGGAVVPGAKRG
jgi:hypothetical protein